MSGLAAAEREVKRFVERFERAPDNHILAVLAAEAHLMTAESCRLDYWPDEAHGEASEKRLAHLRDAATLLNTFDPVEKMSPLIAGGLYTLARYQHEGRETLLPTFEDWVDLAPSNPRIYAAHAPHLLQADTPTAAFDALMAEAERAMDRTEETLGQGGFALCVVPALAEDPELREIIPADRLAGGLIALARTSATQAEVNIVVSELANEMRYGTSARKAGMQSAFDAVVQHDLTVIYPRLWMIELDDIRDLMSTTFKRLGSPLPIIGRLYAPISRPAFTG